MIGLLLNRKYPNQSISNVSVLFISLAIGLFLFVLHPFDLDDLGGNFLLICLGFSGITFVVLFSMNLIKRWLKKFIHKWTILKELLFLNLLLILIALGNSSYLFLIYANFKPSILIILFQTFFIGILPIGFITLSRYNKYKNNHLGRIINDGNKDSLNDDFATFISSNKSEDNVLIPKKQIMYVEAVKNHVHIFHYDGTQVKFVIIRNTLKNVEEVLAQDSRFFKCHRSFIVNTCNIKRADGNTNGYRIYFPNYDSYIPVSRAYAKSFQGLI